MDTTKMVAAWRDGAARRTDAELRHTIASGSWAAQIPPMPSEPEWHNDPGDNPTFAPNLLGLAVKKMSYLYGQKPQRTFDDDAAAEWAEAHLIEYGYGLDAAMAEADAMARLCGESMLYGRYVTDADTPPLSLAASLGDAPVGEEDADGVEWVASKTKTQVDDQAVRLIADLLKTPQGEALVRWCLLKVEEAK